MSDRYEIRKETKPSATAVECGLEWLYPRFVVWDKWEDKRVPFGNYKRHDQAVSRIQRIKERERGESQ